MKHYICRGCGNLIAMVNDSGKRIVCCDEKMNELVPNRSEGSREKHLPRLFRDGSRVTVTVGTDSNLHPMERDHAVNWVCLVTDKGSQRKRLEVGKEPKVTFFTEGDEKILGAFAYCNLHGLWVSEVDKEKL